MKGVDLVVKLRDQLIEGPLESLHAAFLLAFNGGHDLRKLRDLLYALREVVSVLLLHLELELSKGVVDLAVQVNTVANVLEVLVGEGKVSVLLNELLHVSDWLGEVRECFA